MYYDKSYSTNCILYTVILRSVDNLISAIKKIVYYNV